MNLFDWLFWPQDGGDPAVLHDLLESLASALERSGQLIGTATVGWRGEALRLSGLLPCPDALDERHHSEAGEDRLAQLRQHSVRDTLEVFPTPETATHLSAVPHAQRYILQAELGAPRSPLWCPEHGAALPLYLVPIDPDERERVFFWARSAQRLHGLEEACGALEVESYRELSQPDSDHITEALELAALLEEALGAAVYVPLVRYFGAPRDDVKRPCPSCGSRTWRRPLERPPFRCEPCRLVSYEADSTDPEDWEIFGDEAL